LIADLERVSKSFASKKIAAFIESIETGKTFEINDPEARKAVEIVLAIYTSASIRRPFTF